MKYQLKIKGITLIIILSIVMLFSCKNELPVINQYENMDEIPTITAENVDMKYTEKGYLQGRLIAKQFQTFDDAIEPHTDFSKGIKIILYNKEHKVKANMRADSAIYYQNKRSWVAMGNVVVKNVNGSILETVKLYGDDKEKKIFTNQLVKVTQPDGSNTIGKQGFESNSDFTIYKFIDGNALIYVREEFTADANTPTPSNETINAQAKPKKKPANIPVNTSKPKSIKKK